MEDERKACISVIVPIYNVEGYLERCIDSICCQTYENLEILLIDDGSNDGSPQICDRYAGRDHRIKVIHKPNGGLSHARNTGLDLATGKYLAFVDADDYIHHKMFEVMLTKMQENRADIIICDYKEVVKEDLPDLDLLPDEITPVLLTKKHSYDGYYIYEKKARFIVVWNKIYKRELFDGIRFPEGKIHEDTFTTYKVLFRTKQILWIDNYFYFYNVDRLGSVMSQKFSEKRLYILDALQEQMQFLQDKGYANLWGTVFMDYRDYLIQFRKLIKKTEGMDKKQLTPYIQYLNRHLPYMRHMELSFHKKIKTVFFARFCILWNIMPALCPLAKGRRWIIR